MEVEGIPFGFSPGVCMHVFLFSKVYPLDSTPGVCMHMWQPFCCFVVFVEMEATSTAHDWLEVILFLLVSAVSRVWRTCIASRSLRPISMET